MSKSLALNFRGLFFHPDKYTLQLVECRATYTIVVGNLRHIYTGRAKKSNHLFNNIHIEGVLKYSSLTKYLLPIVETPTTYFYQ